MPDEMESISTVSLPASYRPKRIIEQIALCAQLMPRLPLGKRISLPTDEVESFQDLRFADTIEQEPAWLATPAWFHVAPTYPEAVERVLALLAQTRKASGLGELISHLPMLTHDNLCDVRHLAQIRDLVEPKKDEVFVTFPVQTGWSRSLPGEKNGLSLAKGWFPLDLYTVAMLLLMHPERLMRADDLPIWCCGDIMPGTYTDSGFSAHPYFYIRDRDLHLGTLEGAVGHPNIGIATGYLTDK